MNEPGAAHDSPDERAPGVAPESASGDEDPSGPQGRRGHRLLPVLGIGLVILGIATLVASALGAGRGVATPAAPTTTPSAPVATATAEPTASPAAATRPAGPGPARTSGVASAAADTPISGLADPDWLKRTAAQGRIPERALAAYAGAALAVARTDPGCRIGWNTLAAVGEVESAHGILNGAHLDDRGVAVPTIIGIPLDGNGTVKVADTDRGQYDGDTTWDRAVGPMQFIPSTWAAVGQDGNDDGAKDLNQIDDAALAAAVHLCDVGGDLSVAQNWIKAISAYNDSVDYNNRVAAAATRYASLR